MKLLKDLIYGSRIEEMAGSGNVAIESIAFDSREVKTNGLFVATTGTQVDGHQFISMAIEKGAAAIVCEKLPEQLAEKVSYVVVPNSYEALGVIAANFYDNPSENLQLVGVTGTNGKTTVASLLFQLFKDLGYKVGLISTVSYKVHNVEHKSTHTTPNPVALNQLLAEMVAAECTYCFMEVSSHAMVQNRVKGLKFAGGIFTNITHDHLDYHGTFDNYIKAKKSFFDQLPSSAFALYNKDDKHGSVMVQNTKAKIHSYGVKQPADFKARILENQFTGLVLNLGEQELYSRLIGQFNAYNLCAIYATAILLNQEKGQVLTSLSLLQSVAGRFQYFKTTSGITAIVDYAHTPDALQNVLKTIKDIRTGNETVFTLVGCGGDRDKTKRPEMARIACEMSTRVILTSDNPRTESPSQILVDMKAGIEPQHFNRYTVVEDRAEAIKAACMEAQPNDIILIAGKGHETYQEVNGVRHDFNDLEIVTNTLKLLNK